MNQRAVFHSVSQLEMVRGMNGFISTVRKSPCKNVLLTVGFLLIGHALGHGEEFVEWSASSICSCPRALQDFAVAHADQIAGDYIILPKFLDAEERRVLMAVAKDAASGMVGLVSQIRYLGMLIRIGDITTAVADRS